jgi:hypothetical protein
LQTSLDLKDGLVSCDAAGCGCKLKNCDPIVQKQGHYLVALNKNHKHIYEQVSERMAQNKAFLSKDEQVDFGSGRIEKRVC